MKIYLEQFNEETFPDYFAIYLENNGEESAFAPELREQIARVAIDPAHAIVRGIWDSESGTALGYCEVQNLDEPEWEVGIYIPEQYRLQGVGKLAIPLFLDELAAMGKHAFIAKISPDNLVSRRLFEGLGAQLMGMEIPDIPLGDKLLKEVDSKKESANPEVLARLQVLEESIRAMQREVCVYLIKWPPEE